MALSTRIAVMEQGRFLQVGTPREIYEYPANRFVAGFIGTINTFDGIVAGTSDGTLRVESDEAGGTLTALGGDDVSAGQHVSVAVRPEKIFIDTEEPEDPGDTRLRGIVYDLGYFGNLSLYRVRLDNGKIVQVSAQNRVRSASRDIEWDDKVWLSWRPQSAVVLTD